MAHGSRQGGDDAIRVFSRVLSRGSENNDKAVADKDTIMPDSTTAGKTAGWALVAESLEVCDIMQHTATHCNTPQHGWALVAESTEVCDIMQHTATYCNTLQHTATWLGPCCRVP